MAAKLAFLLLLGVGLLPMASAGSLTTCGDLKSLYKTESCCGKPTQKLTAAAVAPAAVCPYDFSKPACAMAEPQAPRDLTSGAPGKMIPKAIVLTEAQAARLPQVNVHFHLGAEHKSEDYQDSTDADAYDAKRQGRRLAKGPVRPGFMCSTSDLNSTQTAPYTFQYCRGEMQVGMSYEVHYVHSSAGYSDVDVANSEDIDGIDDGLGLAAHGRGQLNPMVVVQGQVYQIVQGAPPVDDLLHGWTVVGHADSVMYAGSTTGQSHDNSVCSPYTISWHVDKMCHRVPPESFDNLCKQMREQYNLEADLYPHGSRKILIPDWVVKPEFVKPLE